MFEKSSVMVLLNNKSENQVQLLEVDQDTQKEICRSFAEAATPLLMNKQIVPFDGCYKPNEDEGLSICNFHLSESVTNAIRALWGYKRSGTAKKMNPIFELFS